MKHIFLFPLGRVVDQEVREQLRDAISKFVAQWTDHGQQVHAQVDFPYNSLLLIKAWKDSGGRLDGCAQDALFRFIKKLELELDLPLLKFDLIPILQNQKIDFITLSELREKLKSGYITPETPIILLSVRKEEEWERMPVPLKETTLYKIL